MRRKRSARIITSYWRQKMKLRNRAAKAIQKFFRKITANKLSFPATSKNRFGISSSSGDSTLTSSSSLLHHLTPRLPSLSPTTKVREYFNRINVPVMEGDLFSLSIEHIANNLKTNSFTRCHFHGDRVVSKTRVTREHARSRLPVCLKLSKMEQPKGLPDIL
ncbi:uncharacterized protein LOC108732614 [Agrilus planipennis]|uniref:Uncharacterized protein LOC108732614 n=1 Tax=Agrilus planipennis TaxID=224129 RepID=A0A1W4W4D2_AGRPL|nr:uncharacterized protein LOC108732614 [Agrilus planipennis]